MNKRWFTVLAVAGMSAAFTMTGLAAETQTEAATEAATETVTEAETETEAPAIQTLQVQLAEDGPEVTIENHTASEFTSIEQQDLTGETVLIYGEAFDDGLSAETEAVTESTTEAETQEAQISEDNTGSSNVNLIALDADGKILEFFNVDAAAAASISLYDTEEGTSFITRDENGSVLTDTTSGAMTAYETPKTMYATEYVYVRSQASKDSDPLGTLQYVDQVTALGSSANGWIMIEYGAGYGFVYEDYLSENIDEAQAALDAEEAAQAQAAAEAAAAQAAAQQQASSHSSSHSSGKTIVSQERVPSCDDGSHGTLYITYSDGSVTAQDY